MVVDDYNPSYSGGGEQKDYGWRPAKQKHETLSKNKLNHMLQQFHS
jgi:hypothetical protein